MTNILYARPEQDYKRHDDLVTRLGDDHKIVDVGFEELVLAGQANRLQRSEKLDIESFRGMGGIEADVVLYDMDFAYAQLSAPDRVAAFTKSGIGATLKSFGAPVVVFTRQDESEHYREPLKGAGFTQLDYPYKVEAAAAVINSLLRQS